MGQGNLQGLLLFNSSFLLVVCGGSRVRPDQGGVVAGFSSVEVARDDWESPVPAHQTKVQWAAVRTRLGIETSSVLQLVVVFRAVVLFIGNHWCVWTSHRHCDVMFVVGVRHRNGTFPVP